MKKTEQQESATQPVWRAEQEVRPEHIREQEELDMAREWLRHVEAGRIGEWPPEQLHWLP